MQFVILIRMQSGTVVALTEGADPACLATFTRVQVERLKREHPLLRGRFPYQVVELKLS